VNIDSGTLNVDTILNRVTANPYSTRPTDVEASPAPAEGPIANLALDLTVHVPDNLVLRGNDIRTQGGPALGDLNATVGGTLHLVKPPREALALLGTVTMVRGTYEFQGRQFSMVRNGTIELRGGSTIDPALDLTAEREVSGIAVRVSIGGTARDPKLALSSDPPMSETDILSLIVFNQPANQLGEGQRASLGERAAALASGAVVGALTESVERALNLSVFEVQTVSEAGGAPMITVGKQVSEALFVQLRQLFGSQQVSQLMLEYQLNDYLRLEGEVSEGQSLANRSLTRRVEPGGVDLVLFLRY
jgi:translocation and assembly module TamB